MRYRNKHTGTIVEPSAEVAALNYATDPTWEDITEEQKTPTPSIIPNMDLPTAQEDLDPPEGQSTPDIPEGQNPENGKEEPECSQSEQTAMSQSNTPTDTSPSTTSPKAPSKKGGQTSAKEKKKSASD